VKQRIPFHAAPLHPSSILRLKKIHPCEEKPRFSKRAFSLFHTFHAFVNRTRMKNTFQHKHKEPRPDAPSQDIEARFLRVMNF